MNTSGGNLAECYMHGLEMVNEASASSAAPLNQVPRAATRLVLGGPMVTPVSSLILGRRHPCEHHLPDGLPAPAPGATDCPRPTGKARDGQAGGPALPWLRQWQWGPEWVCHRCHSFDLGWEEVARARAYLELAAIRTTRCIRR